MQVQDSFIVIDIGYAEVSPATIRYLESNFITYRDKEQNEHLINIHDAAEEADTFAWDVRDPSKIIEQVQQIQQLANEHKAAYVRFV